ncbi:MAG: FKBP-type peptidyl-prolyl cis-trans isomerase [Clostridia bacterium]|nr:FKBP-type peptidyl-prolyl cis-trans isomerase [Clostridia bacterium]
MRIAVTYDNGMVFQHFGHTEAFKVYEVENGTVVSTSMVDSNGSGHGALATLLRDNSIDVLICGGIGGGAQQALSENGIELCAGATGNADDAVAAYLRGELVNTGANCDHHHGEHDCGHHSGEHGCEGQGSCHSKQPGKGKNTGRKCRVHYTGTFNDGTVFDSSYNRGEPLEFVCGAGMMIPGFDAAVAEMDVGEKKQIHLLPAEAYGEADPAAILRAEIAAVPGAAELEVGNRIALNIGGNYVPARVTLKDERTIVFDCNHEMAGKELNFLIELLEAVEA